MTDSSQGDGWWLASDGKWYPPASRRLPDPPVLPDPPAAAPRPTRSGFWGFWDWLGKPGRAILIMVLVVLGVAFLGRSSTPAPTEKTFLAALGGAVGDNSESDRIELGHDICNLLRDGESPGAARRYFGTVNPVALSVQLGISLAAATAPGSLCPDQQPRVSAWADEQ